MKDMKKPQPNKEIERVLTFGAWLREQEDREDRIGDLAYVLSKQDLTRIASSRKGNEHKSWCDVVIYISDPEYIAIFNDAWREFELAKQRKKDVSDQI